MQTSAEWWAEVKADEKKLVEWLQKQYHGEITAAERIERVMMGMAQFAGQTANAQKTFEALRVIAGQEKNHALWVGKLLQDRGVTPEKLVKEERYWQQTLPQINGNFEMAAAVAAHAEKMRLERIRVIANDAEAPEDIRNVFLQILPEEEFHERAFRGMTSDGAYAQAEMAHRAGIAAIGLITSEHI